MELTKEQREAFFNHIASKKIVTTCKICGANPKVGVDQLFTLPCNEQISEDRFSSIKGGFVIYFALKCPNCFHTEFFEATDIIP